MTRSYLAKSAALALLAGSSGRGRRRLAAFPRALLVTAVFHAGIVGSIDAADSADASRQIFTVIVTRHGVRSISNTPGDYDWPSWEPVKEGFLTKHGYQLMTLMGAFYGEKAQGIPVDCDHGVFVYADKDQRTLLTAQALVKGLCPNFKVPIFHETDMSASDPIFNGAAWLAERGRIDAGASSRAVAAVAGSPPSTIVMSHAEDFSLFQGLLDRRCAPPKHCAPVAAGASTIAVKNYLAELGGPLATASTYAEDVFLEYAQCGPIAKVTNDPKLQTDLEAAMRLHVLEYDVNARNAYSPLVRGGTLLAHIVGMLDLKAGRQGVLKGLATPDLKDKVLAIFSGHDTQLGALGGILDAHWSPGGGIVRDDMPPGSALVFDLLQAESGAHGVRLRFAAMRLDQFRRNDRIDKDSIHMTPVTYAGCQAGGCVIPLAQFESLALTLQAQGLVDDDWPPYSSDPPPQMLEPLENPKWTQCQSAPSP